jgi:PAS domain S-box-containing protein
MQRFKDMPINRKLTVVILLTSISVLMLAGVAMIGTEFVTTRRAMVEDMTVLADLLGHNSTAALSFHREEDVEEVNKTLSALKKDPHIVSATLFDKQQRPFGRYLRSGMADHPRAQPPPDGQTFVDGYLEISRPVERDGKRIGTIFLQTDLDRMYGQLKLYVIIVALILGAIAVMTFVLSPRLRKPIAGPILELAGVARQVAEKKDYSARGTKRGEDEIGLLTDAFNQMLSEMEGAQSSLLKANKSMQTEIAERVAAEAALRKSEAQIRTIVESLDEGVVVCDLNGQILHFNRAALDSHGYASLDEIRRHMDDFADTFQISGMDGNVLPADQWPMPRVLRGETLHDWEVGIRRVQDDWRRIFRYSGTLVHDAGGQPLMAVLTVSDVTERKQAESEVARLAAIVNSSFDAIIGKDLNSVVTSWNAAAERMFGYSADEIVGRSIKLIIPPAEHDNEAKIVARIKRGEAIEHLETERLRKDGERIAVSVTVSPITDGSGKVIGASAVVRDITERKRAAEQIRQLNTELEQRVVERTAQLQAANTELEAFSYSVSHDLRAPLRSLDGFSQALLEDCADKLDVEGQDNLRRIRAASQRMGQLIDDLLNLSRVTRVEMNRQAVDLSKMARTTLEELHATDSQRDAEFVIEEGLCVQGDPRLLQIIMTNLLGNAWKFTAKRPHTRIELGSSNDNGERTFFVRDNGVGFDMAHSAKLFGAFQRLHAMREFPGTGIGLATVQRIFLRHGGRVWAESAVDAGATFHFKL